MKEGRGIVDYRNGVKFEGEFKENVAAGRGVMKYANGDKYDGNWLEG
jgi:hypothetical protein